MEYLSTRGEAPVLGFSDALLAGLARDGGLYLPKEFPQFSASDIRALRGKTYAEVAIHVLTPFVAGDINQADFERMVHEAYGTFRHEAVCPLVQTARRVERRDRAARCGGRESRVAALGRAARAAARAVRAQLLEAAEFLYESPHVGMMRDLAEYAAPSFPVRRPIVAAARDLTRRIHADFKFDPKATSVSTPLAEVLKLRRGVCQDFAHLMIGCLRALGLSARYVSGYILTTVPAGRPRRVGADASHAWVSVWCGEAGWIDLDPTNDLLRRR